ncbi:hypothetical protein GI584_07045 [Gracilibacillus salitolerans]|uniref:Uncharacterized protein n=1 Tax=Gracilibacillus salitolerans TaxID=2663022 RepID=A0A5Q2TG51_9BACI|nr:hypothetical protein [Gracilibacillus salitolerans]QGH33789.1 hypothetical protein GI584_07045 [Gracilibacillus salitolerans]
MESFLIIAILTGSLIVLLMHWGLLLLQIVFAIVVTSFLPTEWFLGALVIQALFGLWILQQVFQAAWYQYQLELEKTQRIPQHYTEGGRSGIRKNFLSRR